MSCAFSSARITMCVHSTYYVPSVIWYVLCSTFLAYHQKNQNNKFQYAYFSFSSHLMWKI
jgi:hypothetical protein